MVRILNNSTSCSFLWTLLYPYLKKHQHVWQIPNSNDPGNKGDDNTSQQKQLCLNDNWVVPRQEAQGLNPLTSCPSLTPEEGREERWHTTLSSQLHRVERLVKLGEMMQSIRWQRRTHTPTETQPNCTYMHGNHPPAMWGLILIFRGKK